MGVLRACARRWGASPTIITASAGAVMIASVGAGMPAVGAMVPSGAVADAEFNIVDQIGVAEFEIKSQAMAPLIPASIRTPAIPALLDDDLTEHFCTGN